MSDKTTPQDAAAMSPASSGSVSVEPVAWSIQWHGETRPDGYWTYEDKNTAEICLAGCGSKGVVVPLYRHPPCQDVSQKNLTLTDAEREAVEYFSQWCIGPSNRLERYAATLRGLLERMENRQT